MESTTPKQPPDQNSSRRCRASAQSVFARFFLPFSAAASAGSAKCTSAPICFILLHHEPPTRRCLQRHLQPLPELSQEPPDPGPVRRGDPRPEDLAGDRVNPLRLDPPCSSSPITIDTRPTSHRARHRRPPAGQPIAYRQARSVPPAIRMAGRAAGTRARLQPTPFDAEGRPPSPPDSHAKRDITSFVGHRAAGLPRSQSRRLSRRDDRIRVLRPERRALAKAPEERRQSVTTIPSVGLSRPVRGTTRQVRV